MPIDVSYERAPASVSKEAIQSAIPKFDRPLIPLPDHPPFTARFMNLDYRTTEEAFSALFDKSFKISDISLPLDPGGTHKIRGFAFVEFEDKASLEKATHMDGTPFQGRNLRVLVAEQREQRGGFQRREIVDDGKDRDFDNWERRGPLPASDRRDNFSSRPAEDRNYDSGFRSQGREDNRNYNSGFRSSGGRDERDFDNGFRSGRAPAPEDSRNYDNWETRGSLPEDDKYKNARRDSKFQERSQEGSEEDKQADSVNNWRSFDSKPSKPLSPEPAKPAGRKKLNLAPRTKPLGGSAEVARSSTLFGSAKPVDTAKKLLEIEEKQARSHQERVDREHQKASQRAAEEDRAFTKKLSSVRKSFSALSTEDDGAAEGAEEQAPRKKESLTTAEKILAAEVSQEELEGDEWNVVSSKRSGRR